jgi:hypothetical protein
LFLIDSASDGSSGFCRKLVDYCGLAGCITKQLLGLSYIWTSNTSWTGIQIYATWIFYTLLDDLCADVALAMNEPLERIFLQMV